jgi:CSLREA domain-containing protein
MTCCGLVCLLRPSIRPKVRVLTLLTISVLGGVLGSSRAWATAAPTTTTLTVTSGGSSVTSVASGSVVTLTATVVSGTTKVTPGQVKFCDATAAHCEDSALLATAQLTTTGTATFKFRPGGGSHNYQAVFIGTGSYAKSASSTSTLAVTYPTTTTIATSGTIGNYTLTATAVGAGSNTLSPTGDVSFLDTTNDNASLGTVAIGTATPGSSFTIGATSGAGPGPTSVAVGDFNGDGIPDLAMANSGGSTVTVLLGNGDGTFTLKSSPTVGNSPYSVVAGDFNGDGILDLATANQNSNTVTVLLGNGDGTFTAKSTLTVHTAPQFVGLGDFNGDGILDLAVSNSGSNTVTVLLGNGDGTFTTKSTAGVGDSPKSVAVADFNGDGILDLAVASQNDNMVTVLLGNGDGTFTLKSSIPVPGSNIVLAVGDFNGDGIPDLATAAGSEVTALLGNGDGTFTAKTSPAPDYFYVSMVVGDFNGDGILDLALSSCGSNCSRAPLPVPVLLGNGDGSFAAGPMLTTGYLPYALAAGDFNGDGTLDLASASYDDNTVTVLLNQITETATATLSNVSVSGTETHQVVASYPGDANFNSSTSSAVTLLAAKLSTTLTLSSSANPAPPGYQVALTATLSPSSVGSLSTNGETVTFYDGATNIGTGTLSSGVATLNTTSLPPGTDTLTAVYAGDPNFLSVTSNSIVEMVTTGSGTVPIYVVSTNTDDTAGVAANCTGAGSSSCSLRDALAAAAAAGAGDVTFSATVFGATQSAANRTITLVNGTLNIPSNTTIAGLTTGTGWTLTNLVTVNSASATGYNQEASLFTVASGVTNAAITSLTISTGISRTTGGGGILNHGSLSVTNCTISGGNTGSESGGGIYNDGTLVVANSTISGNVAYGEGGGIYNAGTLTVSSSTITGNYANNGGTGIYNASTGTVTLTNVTIPDGVSGQSSSTNTLFSGAGLAPLGNHGGPTQTAPPLPGSSEICSGVPTGAATDQRGLPRTTTYGTTTCTDLGAVQTNYSLFFNPQPPATVPAGANFTAGIELSESGNPSKASGIVLPLALGEGDAGSLNVSSLTTNSAGVAESSSLQIGEPGMDDTLVTTIPLTAAGVTPALSLTATSNAFTVAPSNVQITIASSPAGLMVIADGVSYPAPVTLTWAVGSQHTLAVTSPETVGGGQYTFASWSDGGAASHTVTATTDTTTYTASFTATMYQLNIAANLASEGTITTPSGNYYAVGTVVSLIATPNSGYQFSGWTGATTGAIANPNLFATTITMNAPESVTANFAALPSPIVVTTVSDDATGMASNCPSSSNCSLRDAIAAAAAAGVGNITFDPHVFASPQTIQLGSGGGLTIPSNTTINITGPTTGSGAGLKNLVTVSGGGPVLAVNTANAVISGLTITGGSAGDTGGGGIFNNGALIVSNSTISGNFAGGDVFVTGGGIENYGFLTLISSTVAGNFAYASAGTEGSVQGGGIDNEAALTVINSTIVGNNAEIYQGGGICGSIGASGGGISGTVTMTNSTVAGNSVGASSPAGNCSSLGGGGIAGAATGANNIVSGNTASNTTSYLGLTTTVEDDGGFTNGQNGNFVGPGGMLAPFGSYGGSTQTAPPLPGSPAICAGVVADISPGVTTDQRGFPRTTAYGTNPPCLDSGSVQTNYSLNFSTEPPSTIPAHADFGAAVQLRESGSPFTMSGFGIALALAPGNSGALIGTTSISTNSSGIAVASQLQITAPGSSDKLVASLPLSASGVVPPAIASTLSTPINVTPSNSIQVSVGIAPIGPAIVVDGVSYTAPVTLTWQIGSQHTLAAASPQDISGTQYSFASWSDGGAMSHTVTASATTINYTATFNVAYLLTLSASPSQGGTVSPASGVYYPAGSIVSLIATPNPGYGFAGWAGNVASASSEITTITMSSPQTVTGSFIAIPNYVVTTNIDDTTGTAANCTTPSQKCSLRDALAAAAANTAGADISFDSTVFAATKAASARTITLSNGLNLPANTRILGPTTGSGAPLTSLVTINGKNLFTIFEAAASNSVLSGLNMTAAGYQAIHNTGTLTVANCTISGNVAPEGAGIYNGNTLTVINSVISGNTSSLSGGGIYNGATLTLINSTISGNTASSASQDFGVPGGAIANRGSVAVIGSTISGNTGGGIADYEGYVRVSDSTIYGNNGSGLQASGYAFNGIGITVGTLIVVDSTIYGNSGNAIEVDSGGALTITDSICSGPGCPANGAAGNVTGTNLLLAPLANYGGPTQTMPPLPGSPAICSGAVAEIPPDVLTDQRGYPRTTTYGSNPPCVDSGAVQTNYSLAFSTEPPSIVAPNTNFTAAVQLKESGNPFPASGITIPLTLGPGSTGTLSGGSATTASTGIATYSALQVSAPGYDNSLVATLPLTASGITPAVSASAASTTFDVQAPGSPVAKPVMSPPSGTYPSSQMVSITSATPGATIYFTTDGTVPSRSSNVFNPASPILVSSTETIKAYAVLSGYALSPLGVANYSIVPRYAPTPTFSLAAGTYTSATVGISAAAGATIYYTTNGSKPTTSSAVYSTPIKLDNSGVFTVSAMAVESGYLNSAVAVGTYTIRPSLARPTFNPPGGTYASAQMVTISDTSKCAIYYTTDGSTPTTSSTLYTGPITVSSSETVNAIAVQSGFTNSPEVSATYTIGP